VAGIFSGRVVPRFYFDVREGAKFVPDEEGFEFDSLDAAEREAAESAAEIGRDWLPKGDAREVTVKVKNEHRKRVLTVTVSIEFHRVDPEPLALRWGTVNLRPRRQSCCREAPTSAQISLPRQHQSHRAR
jgi:hypothetical protein